jgi:hypothetical protein
MSEEVFEKYIEELSHWKYYYNKKNNFLDEINRLLNQRNASENKLNLKKDELNELQKTHQDTAPQTLEAQAILLEHLTNIKIDLDKDSVLKWIEAGKLATLINEQKRKANAK